MYLVFELDKYVTQGWLPGNKMLDDPYENLDSKKLSFFHWKSLITTGMGVFTDGYDLSSIGIVLPLVLVSFGIRSLTGIESSLLAGSALIGAVAGALIFGILSNGGMQYLTIRRMTTQRCRNTGTKAGGQL